MKKNNLKMKLNNYDYFFFLIKKLLCKSFNKKYIILLNSTFFISLNTIEIEIHTGLLEKVYLSILSIIIILCLLLSVAYAILLERKILASIQRRRGPNYVGFLGLLQPIADAIKLILKETIIPSAADKIIFILSPLIALTLSLVNWAIIPFFENGNFADINVSILMFFAISSLTVYGIIMSGWSSNSKYAFLGALRAAAQVIAYEVCIGLTLVYILIQTQSLNYNDIIIQQAVIYNVIVCFIFFILFFIACLAETNRPPFDLPEAEAELVSGYNVEYSAMTFGYFFLSEYVSIWTVCSLNVIIFLGGHFFMKISSLFFFVWKAIILVAVFIWVRASVPRYRYDQLMRLGWKILLPVTLGCLLFFISIFYYFSSDDINSFLIIENAINNPSINDLMLSDNDEKFNKEIKDTLEFLIQIRFVDIFIEVDGIYKNTKEALMAEAIIKSMLSLEGFISFEEILYIYNFHNKIIEAENLIRNLSMQYPILKEFLFLYENFDNKILLDAEYYKNLKLNKISENFMEGQSIDCPSVSQKQDLEKIWINLSQNIENLNKKEKKITEKEKKKLKLKLKILKSYLFVLSSVLNVVQLKKPIGPILDSFSWSKEENFFEREERYTVWEMHSKLNKNEKFKADLRENIKDVKIITQCLSQKKNIINFANKEVDKMMPHAIVVRDMILELEKKSKKKIINIFTLFNNNNNKIYKKKIVLKKNIQLSLLINSVLILSNSFLIKLKLDKNIEEFFEYILKKLELRIKAQLSNILRKKKTNKIIKYSYKIIQHEKIEEHMRAHIRTLHCVNIWWKLTLKELNKYYIISKDIKMLTKIRGCYEKNSNINEINILYSSLNDIKKMSIKYISILKNNANNKNNIFLSDFMRQIFILKQKLKKSTLIIRKKIAKINNYFSSNKQLFDYIHIKMKKMRKGLTLKKWSKNHKIIYKKILKIIEKEKLEKKDLIKFKKELKKEGLEKEGWEQEWWDNKNKKDWSWKWMISTIKSISAIITPLDRNNLPCLLLDQKEEWDSENDEEYQLIKKALYNENDGWSSEGELTDWDRAKDLVDWKDIISNIKIIQEDKRQNAEIQEDKIQQKKEEEEK